MSKLESQCFYRQNDGVYCKGGYLVKDTVLPLEREGNYAVRTTLTGPVLIEDTMIKCPCCEEGFLISSEGREILAFMKKHLRSMVQEIMEELTQ